MEIKTIATGSTGNCYLVKGIYDRILIECGLPIKKIVKSLGRELSKVKVCLVSHEHQDHAKAINDIISMGIDIFATPGTLKALDIDCSDSFCNTLNKYETKEFVIKRFASEHDAAEPCGFIIYNKIENKKIVFLTDSYYSKFIFNDVDYFMLEINYQEEILKENENSGVVHKKHADRVRKSHMELKTALDILEASATKGKTKVIPIHMSSRNLDFNFVVESIKDEGFI